MVAQYINQQQSRKRNRLVAFGTCTWQATLMDFILRNSLFESNVKSDKYTVMLFWTIIFYSISVIDLYKFKFETLIEITLTVKLYCDKENLLQFSNSFNVNSFPVLFISYRYSINSGGIIINLNNFMCSGKTL